MEKLLAASPLRGRICLVFTITSIRDIFLIFILVFFFYNFFFLTWFLTRFFFSRSSKAGLAFPVGRVHRLLRKGNYAQRFVYTILKFFF